MKLIPWRCPVCSESLNLSERSFSCANRHTFDKAKEGYVNLLMAHKKKSADPGDSKAMLMSRRSFLERDFYEPLVQALAEQIHSAFPQQDIPLNILDAGCGEGYYAGKLSEMIGERAQFIGVDISKAAMQMAGKRYPAMQAAVASSYDIPLPDNSVDVVIRVFAPALDDEIARVLKPGGLYLWVYPGPQHLFALRELIYDKPQPHGEHMAVTAGLGLLVERMEEVVYPIILPDSEAVAGLLEMTPYYWSASREKQDHCLGLQKLGLEADFRMVVSTKEGEFKALVRPEVSERGKVAEVPVEHANPDEKSQSGTIKEVQEAVLVSTEKVASDPWRKAVQHVEKSRSKE